MATIAVQVQSMLNTAVYDTYVTSDTVTVQTLKGYIYANTSVSAAWYQLYYNGQTLANANTLASLGIGNVQIRSANKIGDLPSREDRQKAKLDLAALDRTSRGNSRDEYDLSELPTQYYGNVIVNNNNVDGLVVGRPWITGNYQAKYASGLYSKTYTGYFNDVPGWFATATQTAAAPATSLVIPAIPVTTSIQLLGYFLPRTTETYTFYTTSDDASYLWVGANAVSGFTTVNAIVDNGGLHGDVEQSGTIALTAGVYYPIRIQVGNNLVTGDLSVAFSTPTITKTTDFSDFIFYNTATNGI